jgi:DNA-binding MarR family transcriptional regulator
MPKTPSSRSAALMALLRDTIATSHRLAAVGRALGAVTAEGGRWGVMRDIADDGPQTVPRLAERRPVSRQHMQTVVDALIRDGLAELRDNPAHKRSKLVALTPEGETWLKATDARVRSACGEFAELFTAKELETARSVMGRLKDALV